jgi:hypothetical protein
MHAGKTAVLVGLVLWTAANLGWSIALSTRRDAEPVSPAHAGTHAHASSAADSAMHTVPGPPRRTLALPNEAREAVLAEMRIMLQSIQGVLVAGARGDSAAVRIAARPAGMAMAADPALEALLPADWMALALDTHRGFDSLPAVGPDPAAILAGLGRLTGRCNACHAMYRLEVR